MVRRIVEFVVRKLLPIAERVAPHLVEKLKINAAVGAEKMHRPHPFSLGSGMESGRGPPNVRACRG